MGKVGALRVSDLAVVCAGVHAGGGGSVRRVPMAFRREVLMLVGGWQMLVVALVAGVVVVGLALAVLVVAARGNAAAPR